MNVRQAFGAPHDAPSPRGMAMSWPARPKVTDRIIGFRIVYNTNHQAQTGGCWANTADELPDCGCADQPSSNDEQAGFRLSRSTT